MQCLLADLQISFTDKKLQRIKIASPPITGARIETKTNTISIGTKDQLTMY
jgi:hypothetical protein